ncbi:N-acetyltransferase [bacterium]|nr:N-acetyltransferase [bacterium]
MACRADAGSIRDIYNHYVIHTAVTFQEAPLSVKDIENLLEVIRTRFPFLVAEDANGITGYAYASAWKQRSAYRFAAECTIYLRPGAGGRGTGTRLYSRLFDELEKLDLHALVGCIALPNPASVALHEKYGFVKVAHFKEVGFKFGRWIDVGYWEKVLG